VGGTYLVVDEGGLVEDDPGVVHVLVLLVVP